jgi:hypothetical protein
MGGHAPRPLPKRSRLRKHPSAPCRHWLSLAKHGNCPMVAAFSGRPSVPDRTPRTEPTRIDHQLGTAAEHPPLPGDVRRSSV